MPTKTETALRARILALEERLAELQPPDLDDKIYYVDGVPGGWGLSSLEAAHRAVLQSFVDDDEDGEPDVEVLPFRSGWTKLLNKEMQLRLVEFARLVRRPGTDHDELGFEPYLSFYVARELHKMVPDIAPEPWEGNPRLEAAHAEKMRRSEKD